MTADPGSGPGLGRESGAGRVEDLDFPYPPCSICHDDDEMEFDEGWFCRRCKVRWGARGDHGEFECICDWANWAHSGFQRIPNAECKGRHHD